MNQELQQKIAGRFMIQCEKGEPFECPHLEDCPHEDKDICLWQLEAAEEIYNLILSHYQQAGAGLTEKIAELDWKRDEPTAIDYFGGIDNIPPEFKEKSMIAKRKFAAEILLLTEADKAATIKEAKKEIARLTDGWNHCADLVRQQDKEIEQLKDGSLIYCVYCGREFLIDDQAGAKVTEHVNTCEKHPLFKANQRIKELESVIESLKKE